MWRIGVGGWAALGLAAVGVASASCESDVGETPIGGAPCDTVYKGQCGAPCMTTGDCPPGLHCRTDLTCGADCASGDASCAPGTVCSADGRCVPGGMGGGAQGGGGSVSTFNPEGSGGAGNAGSGGSCGEVNVTFEPEIPTVVLLIDQSGSMTAGFGNQSRWNAVYDALMDPAAGVVKPLEAIVRFGLVLYTYTSGPTCPELVQVMPPALGNHAAIEQIYKPEVPLANTPTGDSVAAITPALAAFTEPGPKVIVLATDGDPDRCEDPDGHDQISKNEVTAAVQAAYQQKIETVIIAVGDQVSGQHQQDVANAGKGLPFPAAFPCDPKATPMTCAKTYQPATKQELVDAFNEIILGKRTCVFTLDGAVIAGKECEGTVKVNGVPIPCNQPDGWKLNSASEIEFVGKACDTIMTDPNVTITASFPCDAIVK
jgi:hypothetical protein